MAHAFHHLPEATEGAEDEMTMRKFWCRYRDLMEMLLIVAIVSALMCFLWVAILRTVQMCLAR